MRTRTTASEKKPGTVGARLGLAPWSPGVSSWISRRILGSGGHRRIPVYYLVPAAKYPQMLEGGTQLRTLEFF
jgi:hypothetical protein